MSRQRWARRRARENRFREGSRLPVVHFLLLGGLLYAGQVFVSAGRAPTGVPGSPERVVLSRTQIRELDRTWERRTGRLPSDAERRALIRQAVDEELLYREALVLRLDEGNPSVRRRLVMSMGFLSEDPLDASPARTDPGDEESLYQQARELGLARHDPVVRQHLIGLMRNLARRSMEPEEVTEAQLEDYYRRHRERFLRPARVRLSHVYSSIDRHGASLEDHARFLLQRLEAEAPDPEQAAASGDPFMFRHHFSGISERELGRTFGESFAAAAMDLVPGVWSGPIPSVFGLHLVWVHEHTPAVPATLAEARRKVILGLEVERGERRLAAKLEELRGRYEVVVEPAARQLASMPPVATGSGS